MRMQPEPSKSGSFTSADWALALLAQWKLLAIGTLIGIAIAGVSVMRSPHPYVAEALIAPARIQTQVQFEPRIQTVDQNSAQTQTPTSSQERQQALVDLIHSSAIEQQVAQQLQGVVQRPIQPGDLMGHISGGLKPKSEIIAIDADASSPDTAITIANAWANAYVDQVNRIYAPNADQGNSLIALRDQAQADLNTAQDALSTSLQSSKLEELDQQIADRERQLGVLGVPSQAATVSSTQTGSTQITTPSTGSAGTSAPIGANGANGAMGTNGLPPIGSSQAAAGNTAGQATSYAPPNPSDYELADRRTLDDLAQTLRRIDATRANILALINLAQAGGSGASDSAALSLVKAQLVSINDGLPAQVQFQVPAGTTNVTASDLQLLESSLDQARAQVSADFETRRQAYEASRAQQVATLQEELRTLRSQREAAAAERQQLILKRDLASDTYAALARKVEENKVSQGTADRQVELASPASFATQPTSQTLPALGLGAVAGFAAAAVLVLLLTALSMARTTRLPGSQSGALPGAPMENGRVPEPAAGR